MRLRSWVPLVLIGLWAASCTTAPPSGPAKPSPPPGPTTAVESALSTYRTPADAPRILEELDRQLAAGELSLATLATSDLGLYSNLLLSGQRWPEAEQALRELETRTPNDASVAWSLVLLTGARGATAEQARRLAAYEAAHPDDAAALELRARLLAAKGDKAGAKAAWTQVLGQGENLDALTGLVHLALDARRPQEAKPLAERAVQAFPDSDAAWSLRAEVAQDLGRFVEARSDWDRAVAMSPDDPWHRLDRGKLAFLNLYDFDSAQADLEFATVHLPQNFFAWEALAEVYEEQDKGRQAYNAWMKALSLQPDYAFGYPSAAMLSFRYQDWEHAALYAREAAKAHPAEYAFPFVEALSLRALGKTAAAQTVLERARPRFVRGSTVDELFRFLLTPGSDYYFNAAMNLEKADTVRLRLRFYQGCYYALTKSPSSAKAAFEEVSASSLRKIPEIPAARDWLENGL